MGPLLSFVLIRLGANEHWLLRLAHHIIFDAGSMDTFFQELALLYDARLNGRPFPLAERPFLQYADYAAWQRTALHPGNANDERCIEFWRETLAGASISFAFPFARPEREPGADPAAGRMRWGLGHDVLRGLNRIAKDAGATPFMIRLALLAALVAAETGANDVVLGCYVTGRNRSELRDMLALFHQPDYASAAVPAHAVVP